MNLWWRFWAFEVPITWGQWCISCKTDKFVLFPSIIRTCRQLDPSYQVTNSSSVLLPPSLLFLLTMAMVSAEFTKRKKIKQLQNPRLPFARKPTVVSIGSYSQSASDIRGDIRWHRCVNNPITGILWTLLVMRTIKQSFSRSDISFSSNEKIYSWWTPSRNMDVTISPADINNLPALVEVNFLTYYPEVITRFTFTTWSNDGTMRIVF